MGNTVAFDSQLRTPVISVIIQLAGITLRAPREKKEKWELKAAFIDCLKFCFVIYAITLEFVTGIHNFEARPCKILGSDKKEGVGYFWRLRGLKERSSVHPVRSTEVTRSHDIHSKSFKDSALHFF